MFDWNDEELTNIIWDEAGESDGLVPYRDQEEDKKETSRNRIKVSSDEQKKFCMKSEHGVKGNRSSKYDHGEGYSLDSWPDELDVSLSDVAKADPYSTSQNDSLRRDKAIQLNKDSEIFQNPTEGTEQGDFVDYSWANIGSFDDLDRIFSNNDTKFGDMSAGDPNELWSSSKDVTSSPLGPTPLPGQSSSDIKAQYMLDPYEKLKKITSEDVQASIDTNEHYGGKTKLFMKEKAFDTDQYAPPLINAFPASFQYGNPELISSGNKVHPGEVHSFKMTPKEKIEKLRRQQQLRAILAIQKQQQQFGNNVAVAEHSAIGGGTIEVDKNHDDCSVEESVFYQFKDTIAKLELQLRFCIRDSLFRLAQSAMQRKHTSARTSSRDEVLGDEDTCNHERFTRMPDSETDTNPIDRTVAHLLFYRPLESPVYEREDDSLKDMAQDLFLDTQITSPQGPKASGLFNEGNQKNSPCLDMHRAMKMEMRE